MSADREGLADHLCVNEGGVRKEGVIHLVGEEFI